MMEVFREGWQLEAQEVFSRPTDIFRIRRKMATSLCVFRSLADDILRYL